MYVRIYLWAIELTNLYTYTHTYHIAVLYLADALSKVRVETVLITEDSHEAVTLQGRGKGQFSLSQHLAIAGHPALHPYQTLHYLRHSLWEFNIGSHR